MLILKEWEKHSDFIEESIETFEMDWFLINYDLEFLIKHQSTN